MSVRLLTLSLLASLAAAGCGDSRSNGSHDGGVDLCAHSVCMAGDALGATCDACVQEVCARDPNCCQDAWTAGCVNDTITLCNNPCGLSVDAGAVDMSDPPFNPDAGDGAPVRNMCVSKFGRGLTKDHGRLDGYLVSIVPPGSTSKCNGDTSHVHLQILMQGGIYDVAVNVRDDNGGDVYYLEKDMVIPDGAWSEGWHTSDGLGYAQSLGLKSTDFQPADEATLATTIENELANVNHISVFGTGYGSTGIHLIHYNGGLTDGAIVADLAAPTQRVMFFHFVSDTF